MSLIDSVGLSNLTFFVHWRYKFFFISCLGSNLKDEDGFLDHNNCPQQVWKIHLLMSIFRVAWKVPA